MSSLLRKEIYASIISAVSDHAFGVANLVHHPLLECGHWEDTLEDFRRAGRGLLVRRSLPLLVGFEAHKNDLRRRGNALY